MHWAGKKMAAWQRSRLSCPAVHQCMVHCTILTVCPHAQEYREDTPIRRNIKPLGNAALIPIHSLHSCSILPSFHPSIPNLSDSLLLYLAISLRAKCGKVVNNADPAGRIRFDVRGPMSCLRCQIRNITSVHAFGSWAKRSCSLGTSIDLDKI